MSSCLPMPISVRPAGGDDETGADVLVRVVFDPARAPDSGQAAVIHTGLRPLDGTAGAEDWLSSAPVVRGGDAAFRHAHNGEACFGWLYVDATEPLEEATRTAYATAFRRLEELGFAHLLRVWHYLPDIRGHAAGASRYADFCRGRFAAFAARSRESYCAATVIGTRASFGTMYFLAAREPGVAVENPRQTSAWRYPVAVQERPLFARAVCKTWGGGTHFYGSGTAGVVGHESRHPGDTAAQLREALLNLRALLDAAPGFGGVECLGSLKAYVARAADAGMVREMIAASEFAVDSVALFEGKICRAELCVEIEVLIV